MLRVKWFHTHTRILYVATATTPPAAITPASWFMGCERVMRCSWGGVRGGAVLFYDNVVPLYSHKWREWQSEKSKRRGERADSTALHSGGCLVWLVWHGPFCFSQPAPHADRMEIFIVIIALHLRATWERATALRATAVSQDGLEYQYHHWRKIRNLWMPFIMPINISDDSIFCR